MKLCFIADGHSPIAQNWIRHFHEQGHEVHVISLLQCDACDLPQTSLSVIPLGLSRMAGHTPGGTTTPSTSGFRARSVIRTWVRPLWEVGRMWQEGWIGPADVPRVAAQVRRVVQRIRPDLVHAMRIPFEGIVAAEALSGLSIPLLVSVWGNDFTLWAQRSPALARLTRRVMRRADALHSDCRRDLRLAGEFGFAPAKPSVVLPGNGGVQTDLFHPGHTGTEFGERWRVPERAPVVLNPRGFRGYVRNDTFFRAIPLVLAQRPEVIFLALGLHGNPKAETWTRKLGIEQATRLLPTMPHQDVAHLFRRSEIAVSPTEHDGTPNTLLEAMACGAFPVAGDIESVREWIEDGVNGLLFDPGSPERLAQSVLHALTEDRLRARAGRINQKLIAERAEYHTGMATAVAFYAGVIQHATPPGADAKADPRPRA